MIRPFLAALLIVLCLAPARAEERETGTFDVYLGGIRAGVLAYSAVFQDGRYALAGTVRSAGIAAMLTTVDIEADARGRLISAAPGFRPERYRETDKSSDPARRATVLYRGGVPGRKVTEPPSAPRGTDLDPGSQGGTLDPMTAVFALLRDVPRDQICTLDVALFDGRRRSLIRTETRGGTDAQPTCTGASIRAGGFSQEDMSRRTRFDFKLTYQPIDGGLFRVAAMEFDTLFGTARLRRR